MNRLATVSSTMCRKSQKNLRSDARAQTLFVGVAFDRERDEAIEQLRIRESARLPQLRVHADRREARERVHLVQVQHAAVGGEQKIDARQPGAVDRLEGGD